MNIYIIHAREKKYAYIEKSRVSCVPVSDAKENFGSERETVNSGPLFLFALFEGNFFQGMPEEKIFGFIRERVNLA